jgi:hypothetical protein
MSDYQPSAEEWMEYRFDAIIRELDDLCAIANDPETVGLIEKQRLAVGQVKLRVDLIASFLAARQPHLKVVSYHG